MTTQTYARIVDGLVAEILELPSDINVEAVFGPGVLTNVTAVAGVTVGGTATWAPGSSGCPFTFGAPPGRPALTQAQAIAALAAYRYTRETAGIDFTPAGASGPSTVGTSRQAQAQVSGAAVMAGAGVWPDGTPWKMADGSFVPLTRADVLAMATRVSTYVAGCFAREAALAAVIHTGDVSVDITTGWPD